MPNNHIMMESRFAHHVSISECSFETALVGKKANSCYCLISLNVFQKYEKPHRTEEESEEEDIDDEEEDTTSAESDDSEEEEEEEEEVIVQKGDKQNATRQEQLEWDDSTLPY